MSMSLEDVVVEDLGRIKESEGAAAAYELAAANIAGAVSFLLEDIGPQAARAVLATVNDRVEREIRRNNGNSGRIQ